MKEREIHDLDNNPNLGELTLPNLVFLAGWNWQEAAELNLNLTLGYCLLLL